MGMNHITSHAPAPFVGIKEEKSGSGEKEKKTIKTERGELLEFFLEKINNERKGTKYKPISIKFLAVKLGYLSIKDLYYVKSVGLDYEHRHGSFSKYLFGATKIKKV